MSDWSPAQRRWAVLCGVAAAGAFAYGIGSMGSYFTVSDAGNYVEMAHGHLSSMMQPDASRQLGPAVVRLFSWMFHISVEHAFVLQGILSLLVTLLIAFILLVRTAAPRWMPVAVAFVAFWPQLFQGLALPDLWYAALLAVFLLLLYRGHFLLAACMMFPLMVSRESTSLTLVCFLLAGWRRLRWLDRGVALFAAVAGTVLVQHLVVASLGNREHLPEVLYMVAKVPWNFARLVGIRPWSNLYPILCQAPEWQHGLHLGPLHAVGICNFSLDEPFAALAGALTTFGLLPLLTAFLWWRTRKTPNRSFLMRFCLLYGGVSFLLAPMLGVWYDRLYGYGWPIFLIALPMLFNDLDPRILTSKRSGAGLGLLGLHLCAGAFAYCFVPLPLLWWPPLLYIAGFILLRWWFGPPSTPPIVPISTLSA